MNKAKPIPKEVTDLDILWYCRSKNWMNENAWRRLVKLLTTEDHKANRMEEMSKDKVPPPRKQPKKKEHYNIGLRSNTPKV